MESLNKTTPTVSSYNVLEGLQQSRVLRDVFVEWVQEMALLYGHHDDVKINGYGYRPSISSKREITVSTTSRIISSTITRWS